MYCTRLLIHATFKGDKRSAVHALVKYTCWKWMQNYYYYALDSTKLCSAWRCGSLRCGQQDLTTSTFDRRNDTILVLSKRRQSITTQWGPKMVQFGDSAYEHVKHSS